MFYAIQTSSVIFTAKNKFGLIQPWTKTGLTLFSLGGSNLSPKIKGKSDQSVYDINKTSLPH